MEIRDTYTADGKISLQSYLPNHLVYETSSSEPQFAVFSEIWYPRGWQAFLDGKPARHGCVNYLLRGMSIPTGKHTVEFKFAPKSYHIGNMIALVGSLLLLLSIAGSVFMIYRKPELLSSE